MKETKMSNNTITALHLAQNPSDFIVIDVREPAEFNARHIEGARNIPLSKISSRDLEGDKTFVISCLSGKRSQLALDKLQAAGSHKKTLSLDGGLNSWQAAGLPTLSNGKKILPLDRQVQLTIGGGVVVGVLMSFVNPNFIWLAGFFGAGLMFAGATGFCGLARVMALAPWNRA